MFFWVNRWNSYWRHVFPLEAVPNHQFWQFLDSWVTSSFLSILVLFLNLMDLSKIVIHSLWYQLLLVLCVSAKKGQNISFDAIFLGEIAVFCTKTRFFLFLAQVGSRWTSESCSAAFLGPLCKDLGWVHFFFFMALEIGIFYIEIPGRDASVDNDWSWFFINANFWIAMLLFYIKKYHNCSYQFLPNVGRYLGKGRLFAEIQ